MNKIINKLYDLYVINCNKYLVLNNRGIYSTVEWYGKKNPNNKRGAKPLRVRGGYDLMEDHLQGKKTIGVFAGKYFSKFICFDVDIPDIEKAKMVVYKIINTLNNFGISNDYINTSWSGNKGYHIEIFFQKPLSNNVIKKLFNYTLWSSNLYQKDEYGKVHIEGGNVELRPTDTLGVKIPLSCNFRNPDWTTQECWFCDYQNGLKLIKDNNYILSIKKISHDVIYDILNELKEKNFYDNYKKDITKDIVETEKAVNNYRELLIYQEGNDEQVTIEAIERLEKEGLTVSGSRHNSLLKLAKYYRHLGLTQEQTEQDLINWMAKQNKKYYSTKWEDVLKDIKEITKDTFEKGYSLVTEKKNIEVNDAEIKEILKLKSLNEKLLSYALLVHSKRYATKDGTFYMTYKQMVEATGLTEMTCKTLINKLIDTRIIEAVERNITQEKTYLKKPNKYKVLINVSEKSITKVITINSIESMYKCIKEFYSSKELKELLPRRQYQKVMSA